MQVKLKKSSQEFNVNIPDQINFKQLPLGEAVTIGVNNQQITVVRIGDGRSFLINNSVVRIHSKYAELDTQLYRFAVQIAGAMQQVEVTVAPVRAIVGKNNNSDVKKTRHVKAPMTGKILAVHVQNLQPVNKGDLLFIIEAMKMENRILADSAGIIQNLKATAGVNISVGDFMLDIAPL